MLILTKTVFIISIFLISLISCRYVKFKTLQKLSTDNFNLFCFKNHLPNEFKVLWFIGIANIYKLKSASEYNYQMDNNFQLQIRSASWNYKDHNNFTCLLYVLNDKVINQVPLMQSIFIDVIDQRINVKSLKFSEKTKLQLSIHSELKFQKYTRKLFDMFCKSELAHCHQTREEIENFTNTMQRYNGVPLRMDSVLKINALNEQKKSFENYFHQFCAYSQCSVDEIDFQTREINFKENRERENFIKECLNKTSDYLEMDSTKLYEICDIQCSKFTSNCIWNYLHQFRISFMHLQPVLCIDHVDSFRHYIWSENQVSIFGEFTIIFFHSFGIFTQEITLIYRGETVLSLKPSLQIKKLIFALGNQECTILSMYNDELLYLNKTIAIIAKIISKSTLGIFLYLSDSDKLPLICHIEDFHPAIMMDSIMFRSPQKSRIEHFQIFPFALPYEQLSTMSVTVSCNIYLRTPFDIWTLPLSILFDYQLEPNDHIEYRKIKCPSNCAEGKLCLLCAINSNELCKSPSYKDSCVIGGMCDNKTIEVGTIYLFQDGNFVTCDNNGMINVSTNNMFQSANENYFEPIVFNLRPLLSKCNKNIQLKSKISKKCCPPGTYPSSESNCDRCPEGYFSDDGIGECKKCPLLRSLSSQFYRTSLNCENQMTNDLTEMALSSPSKFLEYLKSNVFSSYVINKNPDSLLKDSGFLNITSAELENELFDESSFSKGDIAILKSVKGLDLSGHDIKMWLLLGFFISAVLMILFALISVCIFNIIWAALIRGAKRLLKLIQVYMHYLTIRIRTGFYFFRIQIKESGGFFINLRDQIINYFSSLKEKMKRMFLASPFRLRKSMGYYYFWKETKAQKANKEKSDKKENDKEEDEEDDEDETDEIENNAEK